MVEEETEGFVKHYKCQETWRNDMDKHNANLCILRILQKHTDKDHALTQQSILRLLKEEYDITIDRRSVKSNIEFLQQAGYEIETEGGYRLITRDLEDAELRMLIDSVLFSKYLYAKQAGELIEKLRGMSSSYFNARISHESLFRTGFFRAEDEGKAG